MKAMFRCLVVLIGGLATATHGQLAGIERYLIVLKGTSSFTTSYVVDNSKVDLNAGLGLDRVAAQKPRPYYYLVLQTAYEPTIKVVRDRESWSGDGHIEAFPIGMVTYGTGRFVPDPDQPNGWRWDAKAKYAFDLGPDAMQLGGFAGQVEPWGWLSKGKRVGSASLWWWELLEEETEALTDTIDAGNPWGLIPGTYNATRYRMLCYDTMTSSLFEGPIALMGVSARKMTDRKVKPPLEWYQPSTMTLAVTTPFWQQLTDYTTIYYDADVNGDGVVDDYDSRLEASVSTPLHGAVGAIKFSTDSTLTKIANLTGDPAVDLAAVSAAIDAALVRGKYDAVGALFEAY
ncbi:MAG: hypothetical protein GX595_21250 [Lentisphaerae bacterium]|nr:hypothetical protein [Lentisphaerota bacterium]